MKDGKAYKYALWCVTEQERKVPEYVKKQAESWLYIAEGYDADAYVDEEEYPGFQSSYFQNFISVCTHLY